MKFLVIFTISVLFFVSCTPRDVKKSASEAPAEEVVLKGEIQEVQEEEKEVGKTEEEILEAQDREAIEEEIKKIEELEEEAKQEEFPEKKVYFSGTPESILVALSKYAEVYDLVSSEGQIDYLLMRMQTAQHILERNGERWSVSNGAKFLRWKMGRPKWKGKAGNAQEFVANIATKSFTSGKYYIIRLSDGSQIHMGKIFSNELELLEGYLLDMALLDPEMIKKENMDKTSGEEVITLMEEDS